MNRSEPAPGPGRRRVGDPDGFGTYGVVEVTSDGLLLCSDCGWAGEHLGLHAWRAHQIPAAVYRERHGLRRSKGLVAPRVRDVIRANGQAGMARRPAFVARRDPAAASAARLALGLSASPEDAAARDARISAIGKAGRLGTVIVCGWCAVEFCPLGSNGKRRRFCSRSCASRSHRSHQSHRSNG